MKYTGIKNVDGTPMTRGAYNMYRGWTMPPDENPEDEGYLVEYEVGENNPPNHPDHKGWISWSPKLVFEESYYQSDFSDTDFAAMSLQDMAIRIAALKDAGERLSAIKAATTKAYDYLTISITPDKMEDEDVETMKIAGVGRLQVKSDIRCSLPAKNRDAMKIWLEDEGHESMVTSTVNSSTLKAFVKERMKDDLPYPKELLKVEPYSRATVVKG